MSMTDWANQNGQHPRAKGLVIRWFDNHPEATTAARQGRAEGYSEQQILDYLQATWGYPFTDVKTVRRAWL